MRTLQPLPLQMWPNHSPVARLIIPAGTPPRRSASRRRAKLVIAAARLQPLTSPMLSTTFPNDARRKRVERCCRDELHG